MEREAEWQAREATQYWLTVYPKDLLSIYYEEKYDHLLYREALKKIYRENGFILGHDHAMWQADHIHPVGLGGGGCGLENIQTLCHRCHAQKSAQDRKRIRDSKKAAKP
jgi:5-methylcytosine-specific restriction endonuclease McrA